MKTHETRGKQLKEKYKFHWNREITKVLILSFLLVSCSKDNLQPIIEDFYTGDFDIIDGYTDKLSYHIGDTIHLFLNTEQDTMALITINDINGNEVWGQTKQILNQNITNEKPWKDGFGYDTTISVVLNENEFETGVFFTNINNIPIIIKKQPYESTNLLIVLPTNTMHAYTTSGGKSFYYDFILGRGVADELSFLRPYRNYTQRRGPVVEKLRVRPGISWLFNEGYDCNFISDYDMENKNYALNSDIIVIVGHSEFWSKKARMNFDNHVDNGKNALILSGNTMWKQIDFEENGKKMYSYTDDHPEKNIYPDRLTSGFSGIQSTNNYTEIGQFYETSEYPVYPSIGADWWNGGYGYGGNADTIGFGLNQLGGYKILDNHSALFNGTGIEVNDIFNIPTREFDGCLVKDFDQDGNPKFDTTLFHKINYYGYNIVNLSDNGVKLNYSALFAFQKSISSGVIINTSSQDWCYETGLGSSHKNAVVINKITKNMIDVLQQNNASEILFD
ncbi:MAG: hypothetical protein QNK67_05280 [Flavobacteriales bacterium]